MATEIITSFEQICDSSGDPLSGALVYVYDVGTTTLKSVWTDTALSIAGANPIVADSAGRHDMRYIAAGSYKIVVKTSAGVTQYTRDNIDGRVPVGSGALAIANGGTGSTTASAAIAALGGATSDEVAGIAAQVAAIVNTAGSLEGTHIATGTTAQRAASPLQGDIRRNTTTSEWEGYTGSAWENLLVTSDLPVAGSVVKSSYTEYTSSANLTTAMPYDNTIPQITEGTEIITVSFTPTSATNLLRFTFQGFFSHSTPQDCCVALFGGGVANAIAASGAKPTGADNPAALTLTHQEVSGVTTAKTFAIRVGPDSTGTMRMNGTSAARRFGGVAKSTLVIEEIKV